MAMARARRDAGMNYWPGFVDALSTLVLGIIFLLTVFVVVQFYLTQEVSGKDTLLTRLNSQIAQLTDLLALEKIGKLSIDDELTQLRSSIVSNTSETAESSRVIASSCTLVTLVPLPTSNLKCSKAITETAKPPAAMAVHAP